MSPLSSPVKYSRLSAVALLALALVPTVDAAVLVYEGFNGYTGSTFMDGATALSPNSNTIGLNTGVAYSGSGLAGVGLVGTSLLFSSNFLTTGGSVRITSGTSVAAATLAIGTTAYTGTLYSSYLVNFGGTSRGTGTGDGALIRIANNNATSLERFENMADWRTNSGTASPNIGAGYDGGTTGSTVGNAALLSNTTYLMIARFTNVGSSIAIGAGVGNVFALTAEQYDSFLAAGATDAYLDAASTGTGPTNVSAKAEDSNGTASTFAFATGNFSHFVSVNDNTAFDEIRYGSTLGDVVAAVPEPSSAVCTFAGAAVMLMRRRRTA